MAEPMPMARLIAGREPLAIDTVEGVSASEPDPCPRIAISGMEAKRIIVRRLPL